jgi:hypothetical protein
MVGGGKVFGGGGGKVFGGGGVQQFGAGGGKVFGGGGGLGDLTQSIANSFTRPTGTLSVTMEDPSPRYIHLKWTAPNFGQIGAYRIYRSADGGHTFNPVPNGNNGAIQAPLPTVPGAQVTYTDTVTCNTPKGYQYYVTGLLAGTFPPFPPKPQKCVTAGAVDKRTREAVRNHTIKLRNFLIQKY